MDASTKMIQLTGGATKRPRGPRTSRATKATKTQRGGSLQSDVIVSKFPDAMAPSSDTGCMTKGYQTPTAVHGAPLSLAFKPVMPQVPESAVALAASYPPFPQGSPSIVTPGTAASTTGPQVGGKVEKKVVLQSKSKTVQLVPKKGEHTASHAKPTTRKTRRITLGLQALKKRQTRAHKIQADVKEMPIAKVREHLVTKKLIKATSKAPEKVLRQIAIDAQIVAGKGL